MARGEHSMNEGVRFEAPRQPHWLVEWMRVRLLGMALSFAATLTFLSLLAPAWLDFLFDLAMLGTIAIVGKLARRR